MQGVAMITGIHHVQITIPPGAEDEARVFYCRMLDLPEVEKPESLAGRGGFWVEVGDREVHIGVEDGVERRLTKAHIAYEVDDLELWKARLFAGGIPLYECPTIPGYDRIELRDPFGNRVEFICRA